MRRIVIAAVAASLPLLAQAQDEQGGDVALETPKQRFSYGIGIQIARSLFDQGVTSLDTDAFALAIGDALEGRPFRLSVPELQAAFEAYKLELQAARMEEANAARDRGTAFLATNREKDGVVELESGLQYLVVTEGDGEVPSETDTVRVNYRGKLLDGTEFDSSYGRGEPSSFQVGQVIRGWQQALQLMKVGSTWQIWIPSDLAYGANGAGARIGPNETLHFEVELLSIEQ